MKYTELTLSITLKEIEGIESWYYEELDPDSTLLEMLQTQYDDLSILFSRLSEYKAEAYREWKIAEGMYEIAVLEYRGSKTKAKSSSSALIYRNNSDAKESDYRRIQYKMDGIEKVLNAMSQRIGQWKKEWELDHFRS